MALLTRWPLPDDDRWYEDFWKAFSPTAPTTAPFLRAGRTAGVFPPVNIYDDGENFLVRAEIPGVDKKTLDIAVRGNQLTIRGERNIEPARDDASYHRRERSAGKFRRVVTLPERVDADKISAKYRNGVLEITLPRSPEARERRIEIH
jgi:HSP20 family protein